jgi:hypothetical protein
MEALEALRPMAKFSLVIQAKANEHQKEVEQAYYESNQGANIRISVSRIVISYDATGATSRVPARRNVNAAESRQYGQKACKTNACK